MKRRIKRASAVILSIVILITLSLTAYGANADEKSSGIVAAQMEHIAKQKGKDAAAELIDISLSELSTESHKSSEVSGISPVYSKSNAAKSINFSKEAIMGFSLILLILILSIFINYRRTHKTVTRQRKTKSIQYRKN